MHFFFRTNFNRNIGLGHIIRSLRLFNELKKNNICKIYIDKYDESISNLIPKIICEELYKKKKFNSQIEDAKLFLSKIKKFKKGYVVIDDYRLDATWEKILSDNNFKIITLDDLENRAHYADFIINYDTQYLDKKEYSFKLNKKKDGRYLLGPRYCILPKIPTLKKIKRKNTSFFITMYMGGGGNLLAISHLIKQLQKKIKKNIFINVIIGPLSKNKNLIIKLCENNKNIIPIENCANLIDIYRKSDLFIGAAGTSVFETAVTKLPSILISIAKNQMTNVLSLEKIGHYFFLKNSEIKDIKKLSELIYIMTREYKRVEFLTKSAESKINSLKSSIIISVESHFFLIFDLYPSFTSSVDFLLKSSKLFIVFISLFFILISLLPISLCSSGISSLSATASPDISHGPQCSSSDIHLTASSGV